MLTADYRRLVGELAGAARRRDDDLEAAEQSYLDGVAALRASATEAARAIDEASARQAAASAAVEDTDREAERLWATLRGQLGWRGRRLPVAAPGPAPVFAPIPAPVAARAPAPASAPGSPATLLAAAAGRIAGLRHRARPGAALPPRAMPMLSLIGAAGSVAVGLVAGGLATAGGVGLSVLAGLSWVVFLLAPFAGLPLARRWALRRHGATLDTGAIGLTVFGGMVACTALVLVLR